MSHTTPVTPKAYTLCCCLKRRHGFSLIELLVVIAVVGVLSTLLVSGISSSRQSAAQIEAAMKLRSIGLAIQFYVDENEGSFPGPLRGYQKPTRINNFQLIRFIEEQLSGMQMPTATAVNPVYVSKAYSSWLEKSNYSTPASVSGADAYVMYTNHTDPDGNVIQPWGEPAVAARMTQQQFFAIFEPGKTRAMWDAQGSVRSPNYNELYKGRNVLFFDWHVERVSAP